MLRMIQSELRKSWKSKQIAILIIAFLCLFGVLFRVAVLSEEVEYRKMSVRQNLEYKIIKGRYDEASFNREPKEITNAWNKMQDEYYDWATTRYNIEYFGWEKHLIHSKNFHETLLKLKINGDYQGELDQFGYTDESIKTKIEYSDYLLKNNIELTVYPNDPTLSNFSKQLLNRDSVFMFLIVTVFFMLYQVTHDMESGTYKQIYSSSIKREKIIAVKMFANFGNVAKDV